MTPRNAQYRVRDWGATADWVVTRRDRNGDTYLQSESLGTTLVCHESRLIVVDRGGVQASLLDPHEPVHGLHGSAAAGASPPALAASSARASSPVRAGTPVARNTDPASAHLAAVRARNNLTDNQRRVLIAHAEAGTDGLSGDEMAEKMGGEANYALYGPRRPALERAGFLEKAGLRPNRRGNLVQVYRCTPSGFALAEQWIAADRARGVVA